jgi:hypothetical protein
VAADRLDLARRVPVASFMTTGTGRGIADDAMRASTTAVLASHGRHRLRKTALVMNPRA